MTLKHFINEVAQLLQEHLGEHYIVETATTLKNNSVELSGVQIRHKKDNIFPTIYLNDFYELYEKNSVTMEEIVDKVAEGFQESRKSIKKLAPLDSTTFAGFAKTKSGNAGKYALHSLHGSCYHFSRNCVYGSAVPSFHKNHK